MTRDFYLQHEIRARLLSSNGIRSSLHYIQFAARECHSFGGAEGFAQGEILLIFNECFLAMKKIIGNN